LHLVYDNQDNKRLGTNAPCGWPWGYARADLRPDVNAQLLEALRDARAFMDACQMNDSDDPADRSDDQSPLDALKERTDASIADAEAAQESGREGGG
jgi:hypothetical protein